MCTNYKILVVTKSHDLKLDENEDQTKIERYHVTAIEWMNGEMGVQKASE